MSEQPDHGDRPDSRGTWWVASIAVILLILAGLVAVLVWGGGGEARQAAAPRPGVAPDSGQSPSPTPTTESLACAPSDSDQSVPSAAPRGVQWSVVNTVALPWSPTAGALRRNGALWSCYARTPTGALLAATVLSVTPDGPAGADVLEQQAVPGPNRQARIASLRRQPPAPKRPGETATIAGFKFLSYGRDQTTVQIVGAFGGKYLVVTVPLVWAGGDWKLNLDTPGGTVPGQALPSLVGYTEWGAE